MSSKSTATCSTSDSHLRLTLSLSTIMRYIPSSRYTLDEIAEQCRAAINRPAQYHKPVVINVYDEVRKFYRYNDTAKFWSYDASLIAQ